MIRNENIEPLLVFHFKSYLDISIRAEIHLDNIIRGVLRLSIIKIDWIFWFRRGVKRKVEE